MSQPIPSCPVDAFELFLRSTGYIFTPEQLAELEKWRQLCNEEVTNPEPSPTRYYTTTRIKAT